MVGRADLIEAAALQAAPYEYAVARPMKASKETILGLLAALEAYLEEDETGRFEQWFSFCDQLEAGFNKIPGLVSRRLIPNQPGIQPAVIPRISVKVDPSAGFTLQQLNFLLQNEDPPILVTQSMDALVINPHTLTAEEVQIILSRFRAGVQQLKI
jgi:D-glucosaminate-6-phosphate ammonia-lyase